VDLRETQPPLKEPCRSEPAEARITLSARGSETAGAAACSVDIGRAVYAALTCQMVAASSRIPTERIELQRPPHIEIT